MILGPTGVGKSELCLRVAEYFHIPIINADSRQIFREIPIGTAAPTEEQQRRVKHYFVGTHSIEDYYSASMYEEDAVRLINQLLEHDKFVQFALTDWTLEWYNGVDFAPERLYELGKAA